MCCVFSVNCSLFCWECFRIIRSSKEVRRRSSRASRRETAKQSQGEQKRHPTKRKKKVAVRKKARGTIIRTSLQSSGFTRFRYFSARVFRVSLGVLPASLLLRIHRDQRICSNGPNGPLPFGPRCSNVEHSSSSKIAFRSRKYLR